MGHLVSEGAPTKRKPFVRVGGDPHEWGWAGDQVAWNLWLGVSPCRTGMHGLHSAWQAGVQGKGTWRAWLQGTQKEAGVSQELMSHIQHTSHIHPQSDE